MDNKTLAQKLESFFPITNIKLRIEIVSVLKVVLSNGTHHPNKRFEMPTDGVENLLIFVKDLVNQPLLREALFPNHSLKEARDALSELTPDGSPSVMDICSMLVKNIIMDDLKSLEDGDGLSSMADMLSTPEKRKFIWQMMNQDDINDITQQINNRIESREERSISDITEEDLNELDTNSVSTENLYEIKPSASSPTPSAPVSHSSDEVPRDIRLLIKDGHISSLALTRLINAIYRKVEHNETKESIATLRFIYNELQKEPAKRIPSFRCIIDKETASPIVKNDERQICYLAKAKLAQVYRVGTAAQDFNSKRDPRVARSQDYKAAMNSLQQSDDATHVLRYKNKKSKDRRFNI